LTAEVRHAELWGTRKKKYDGLHHLDIDKTRWEPLDPAKPFHLFVPQDTARLSEYEGNWKVTHAMPINVLGFQTHRDHFAIDFEESPLRERIGAMLDASLSDQDYADRYQVVDNPGWSLSKARKALRSDQKWETKLVKCLYRPFDWRFCYFSQVAMDRPRRELMTHVMARDNLCLLSSRQQARSGYRHVWCGSLPPNDCVISTTSREANQGFPLYLYPNASGKGRQKELGGREPNLAAEFVADIEKRLGQKFMSNGVGDLKKTFGPEDVFHYMYAVLHSPTYRKRYAEFLKIDFPRIPLTSSRPLFRKLCKLGAELTALHLMEKHGKDITSFPVKGDNVVEKVRYEPPAGARGTGVPPVLEANHGQDGRATKQGRVWINKTQYVEGVPPEVWEFHVGGYQVCQKWLKDRKGRTLSFDDIQHYEHIVAALNETIRLMERIDKAIPSWPIQ